MNRLITTLREQQVEAARLAGRQAKLDAADLPALFLPLRRDRL
jgi:hypothetical protein